MASNVSASQVSPDSAISEVSSNVQEALRNLIGSKSEVKSVGVDVAFTSSVLKNLKASVPDVLVVGQIGDNSAKTSKIDLSSLGSAVRAKMSALIFDSDQPVSLKGLSGFAGVISLGNGNNVVSASDNSKKMTVSTGTGNDNVATGSGADTVSVGGGADTVSTGSGKDKITIDSSISGGKISSGDGNDVVDLNSNVQGGSSTKVTIDGGSGTDTLDLRDLSIATVTKKGTTATITLNDGSKIVASNIEKFIYTDPSTGAVDTVGVKISVLDSHF